MAQIVHEFDPVERFVAGTVGEPGERSFFLQAKSGKRLISVLLEKSQVLAVAERLALLLKELRRTDTSLKISPTMRDDLPLDIPIMEEFRVGAIGLAWISDRQLVQIDLQAGVEASAGDQEVSIDEDGPDLLRVFLTLGQVQGFVDRSLAVVSAGRPPCPFCGMALDPSGHVCPRANGYRR